MRFSVGSFNVHWGGLRPSGRPYDVVTACLAIDTDVLVLQEAWWADDGSSFLDEVATQGKYELVEHPLSRGIARRDTRERPAPTGNWGLAVLSRFPVLGTRRLPLGEVPIDRVSNRSALHAQLDVNGDVVDLVAVHASALTVVGPVLQLRRLRPQLPSGRPLVIAGDLNITPGAVGQLLGEWTRAVVGNTWPSPRAVAQIDHVLVSEHFGVERGDVLPDLGSDHYPIRAELVFDTPP